MHCPNARKPFSVSRSGKGIGLRDVVELNLASIPTSKTKEKK